MSQLYLCSTGAESHLKLSHSHLKPLSPCKVVWRSWGVDVAEVVLFLWVNCFLSLAVACLSCTRNHSRSALWPLIPGHVPPNQLELRTCIPHRCGNDYQDWACSRAESIWFWRHGNKIENAFSNLFLCCLWIWKQRFLLTLNASCEAEKKTRRGKMEISTNVLYIH